MSRVAKEATFFWIFGGFILDGATGVPDEAKYECVAAMAASVHKYDVY